MARINAMLRVIAELGSARLESLIRGLEPGYPAIDTERAFQTAREREWIMESDGYGGDRNDPRYRLTQRGLGQLSRAPGEPPRALKLVERSREADVPVLTVPRLVAEFEVSGGASIQLAAWELDVDERRLETA